MNSKELQNFIEKLKKQKSKEYFQIFTDFQELFKKYFKKQVKQYLKQVDELPLQKSLDDKVQRQLMKALKLGKKEELEDFIKDKIRVGEKKEDILLNNDFLKEYAKTRAGELISQIDETTKKIIQNVFTNAFKYWYTKAEVAEIIREKFDTFAWTRATLIAHMEIANAYAWARKKTYEKIQEKTGVERWKRAKTQHDDKVRPSHKENEMDGWIKEDEVYSGTWTLHAPHWFFCRCDDVYTYNPDLNEYAKNIVYEDKRIEKFDNMFWDFEKFFTENDLQIIQKYDLTKQEYIALQLWWWEIYSKIVNWFYYADTDKTYQTIIPVFMKALCKLPDIEGRFYRWHNDFMDEIQKLEIWSIYQAKTFLSFSKDLETAKEFNKKNWYNIIYVVKTKQAKDMSMIEWNSYLENEVLILANKLFVIEGIKKINNITYVYLVDKD